MILKNYWVFENVIMDSYQDLEVCKFTFEEGDKDMWHLLLFIPVYNIETLPKNVAKKLAKFYFDKIQQLTKQFKCRKIDKTYMNAIHYCICSGYDFYKNLNTFKFTICLETGAHIHPYWIDRLTCIMRY